MVEKDREFLEPKTAEVSMQWVWSPGGREGLRKSTNSVLRMKAGIGSDLVSGLIWGGEDGISLMMAPIYEEARDVENFKGKGKI